MIKYIGTSLRTSTARDSFILLSGTVLSTVTGFLGTILLTRNLSPDHFGLFITAVTFSQLVSDLFESGINSALLNLLPRADEEKRKFILKAAFLLRIAISFPVAIIIFLAAPFISELVFNSSKMMPFIQISSIGILLLMFTSWFQAVFQSYHRFFPAMVVNSSINILRLLVIGLLIVSGVFNVINGYWAIQLVVLLSLAYAFLVSNLNFLKVPVVLEDTKKLLFLGLPVGLGFACAAVYTKLDQIFIFNMVGEKEAGIYGLAFRVAAAFIFATAAFGSAIVPRFSSLHKDSFYTYFKKTLIASLGLSLGIMAVVPLAPYVMPVIFGEKFSSSIIPFQILTVGAAIFTVSSVFTSAIVYHFKKPTFSLITSTLSLGFIWLLLSWLVPIYQSIGAALAVSIVYGVQLIVSVAVFYYLIQREND